MKVNIDNKKKEILNKYIQELLKWNNRYNLISKNTVDNIWEIHVNDSLQLYEFIEKENENCIVDIGSGAGFPSIPLSIMLPEKEFILTEKNSKKLAFLYYIVNYLNINCKVYDLNKQYKLDKNCINTTRAFSNISEIIRWVNKHTPLSKRIYIQKGKIENINREIYESKIKEYKIIDLEKGNLVIIENKIND